MERDRLLRQIPRVDTLYGLDCFAGRVGAALTGAVRETLDALRAQVLAGEAAELPSQTALCAEIFRRLEQKTQTSLRPVVNGTGVVLHTNLGRACLSEEAVRAAVSAAGYCTLEYDAQTGGRGSRQDHVEALLCRLTGAEAALTVNNNAAAVLLAVSALAKGREVVVSRGELVEIGGAFRVPEVLEQGGALLREVGTTNRTRLDDYARAITSETGALLKVHTSNYRIVGFTESVALEALCELGRVRGLPVIADLGSGALLPPERLGLAGEPWVLEAVAAGTDVAAFSADKLLGGPQAGVLVGKKECINRMKAHPLARAVRIDKLNLAALEATLCAYLDPERALRELPVLAMFTAAPQALRQKAQRLLEMVGTLPGVQLGVEEAESQAGGGTVPGQSLPSWALAIQLPQGGADALGKRLRLLERPIVGRIHKGKLLLDVRTLFETDFAYLAQALQGAVRQSEEDKQK